MKQKNNDAALLYLPALATACCVNVLPNCCEIRGDDTTMYGWSKKQQLYQQQRVQCLYLQEKELKQIYVIILIQCRLFNTWIGGKCVKINIIADVCILYRRRIIRPHRWFGAEPTMKFNTQSDSKDWCYEKGNLRVGWGENEEWCKDWQRAWWGGSEGIDGRIGKGRLRWRWPKSWCAVMCARVGPIWGAVVWKKVRGCDGNKEFVCHFCVSAFLAIWK